MSRAGAALLDRGCSGAGPREASGEAPQSPGLSPGTPPPRVLCFGRAGEDVRMHCLPGLPAGLGDQVVRGRARRPVGSWVRALAVSVGHLLALRCPGRRPCPDCPVPLDPVCPALSLPTMGAGRRRGPSPAGGTVGGACVRRVFWSRTGVCVQIRLGTPARRSRQRPRAGGGGLCLLILGPVGGGPAVRPPSSQDAGPTQGLPPSVRPLGWGRTAVPSPTPPRQRGCPRERRPGIAGIGSGSGEELSWQSLT